MDILELLNDDEDAIVAEALTAVTWLEHYERDGEDLARERLRALCRLVAGAIRTQDLAGARRPRRPASRGSATRPATTGPRWRAPSRRSRRPSGTAPSSGCPPRSGPGGSASWARRSRTPRRRCPAPSSEAGTGTIPAFVDLSPLFRGTPETPGRFADDMVYPV